MLTKFKLCTRSREKSTTSPKLLLYHEKIREKSEKTAISSKNFLRNQKIKQKNVRNLDCLVQLKQNSSVTNKIKTA